MVSSDGLSRYHPPFPPTSLSLLQQMSEGQGKTVLNTLSTALLHGITALKKGITLNAARNYGRSFVENCCICSPIVKHGWILGRSSQGEGCHRRVKRRAPLRSGRDGESQPLCGKLHLLLQRLCQTRTRCQRFPLDFFRVPAFEEKRRIVKTTERTMF